MAKKTKRKTTARRSTRKATARKPASQSKRTGASTKKRKAAGDRPRAASAPHAKAGGVGSDAVKKATGKSWDQWFAILDKAGAAKMTHKQIAELLHDRFKGDGLTGWWAQMVTVGYEQHRGLREKHQKPDGYQISGSKTFGVPVRRLFDAFHDPRIRRKWLDAAITIRKATAPKSLRVTWKDGRTHVDVNLYPKGDARSYVSLQHSKLPDAKAAEKMKAYWGTKLEGLKAVLEG